MIRRRIAQRGDVYWVDPNPVAGHEMKDRHRFVVITPQEINALGICMMVPITGGGAFARATGLTVPIHGFDTRGVAVCNQVRSFDLEARERQGSAKFLESLDAATMIEIVNRVLSVIEP
ncbi:MAG: type II toxin-antitoxin system PemK/MazF family toxin, partial [Acidobacteriota bacterium]|nr:type II toxin-antitoxin system PemK/MazF family toxin [Acidobacteriota bacterium]